MRISDWSSDVCSSDLLNGGSAAPIIVSPNRGRGQRMVDILVASMAAVAAAPLMLLAAAAIAVGLGRPVLFTQTRAGRNGRPFRLVKFRTMTDARDRDGRLLPDEERLTRLCRFLRRRRGDELPELWNVMKGDRSLVGTR